MAQLSRQLEPYATILGFFVPGFILAAAFTHLTRDFLPVYFSTDACPQVDQICGQPATGFIVAGLAAVILTSTIFYSGMLVGMRTEETRGGEE